MGNNCSDKLGCDDFCDDRQCRLGQGDCNSNDECWKNLKCGTSNCRDYDGGRTNIFDSTDDCCYDETPPTCLQGVDGCCTRKLSWSGEGCSIGEGDCDTDAECTGNLLCGTDICKSMKDGRMSKLRKVELFEYTDDCCYDPTMLMDSNALGGDDSVGAEVMGLATALGIVIVLVIGLYGIYLKLRKRRATMSAEKANLIHDAVTYKTTAVSEAPERAVE